jgi:IPTL-CTERM motif/PEP-CTERM motif
MIMNKFLLTLVAAGAFALAVPAHATIIFTPGNNAQADEQNIFFTQADLTPRTFQVGSVSGGLVDVEFNTVFAAGPGSHGGGGTGQFITANGIGQSDIVCTAGGAPCVNNGGGADSSQLTSLQITLEAGFGVHDFIGNPTHGHGTMNVYVQDNFGNNFTFTLNQGQDFFILTTADNEAITNIQLTQLAGSSGPFGFSDLAQPRVSGVCTLGTTTCEPVLTPVPTPEPASLAVLAVSLAGLGFIRRRRA